MSDFWQRAFAFPFLLFLFALLVWPIAGALPAALIFGIGMSLRLLSHLRNLAAFEKWLSDPDTQEVPDGSGLWEDAFSQLNKLTRQRRKDREQHAAALHQMEQATSALPEGVVILDEADRIEWCNPLAEHHFGLDGERDIGQQITYLARQPEFVQYLVKKDFAEPLVLRGTRHDDLVLSIKLIAYGGSKRLLISRDITHLERIETMRRDFVANVSHELRTPLTVVNGFVETLQDMPQLENDMARRALQLMGDQTSRMENLVDDLLTLSRLENEQNVLIEEKVDVPELMRTLYEEGRSLSNGQHRIKLEINSEARVAGNTGELHSAFVNLVSNAIRYTPPGGDVVLRWSEQPDGHTVFSVKDSGIGIAPQHISRLTERFYRVDRSRSRETGGTGLGLAIVKHIIMRHQAQLEVASEEGKGSTFSIVFPAKRRIAKSGAND
ncbi:MAG: phosphate regulon sensor histidine kinase PhoR [Gammaproteobacteria bacterium]|nr:phosphate regulon sensor histidine kinase PhoR [Gammaproteobacteria bacterium]MBU1480459.1 phosphate regulon sensor histidine kinase PhoR [Gammaproteobacteria bacterium]